LFLNRSREPLGYCTAFVGHQPPDALRSIFKVALAADAHDVYLCRFRSSGNLYVARAEAEVAEELSLCGDLLFVDLVDFLVIGPDPEKYVSLGETGDLDL